MQSGLSKSWQSPFVWSCRYWSWDMCSAYLQPAWSIWAVQFCASSIDKKRGLWRDSKLWLSKRNRFPPNYPLELEHNWSQRCKELGSTFQNRCGWLCAVLVSWDRSGSNWPYLKRSLPLCWTQKWNAADYECVSTSALEKTQSGESGTCTPPTVIERWISQAKKPQQERCSYFLWEPNIHCINRLEC